jgi:hypothetical protein
MSSLNFGAELADDERICSPLLSLSFVLGCDLTIIHLSDCE